MMGTEAKNDGIRRGHLNQKQKQEQFQKTTTRVVNFEKTPEPDPIGETSQEVPPEEATAAEKFAFLIQIVSFKKLKFNGVPAFHPYIEIMLDEARLHSTKRDKKPNSSFTCSPTKEELEEADGLTLNIRDWDLVSDSYDIGCVTISPETIYEAVDSNSMEVRSFEMLPPPYYKNSFKHSGTIEVRLGKAEAPPRTKTARQSRLSITRRSSAKLSLFALDDDYDTDSPFVVEIIACRDLLISDESTKSSDPYVVIAMGEEVLHQTLPIRSSLSPAFNLKTNNLFYCDKPVEEIYDHDGLFFTVRDGNRDNELGSFHVPSHVLYDSLNRYEEKRMAFPLVAPEGTSLRNEKGKIGDAGFVTILTRRATESERESQRESAFKLELEKLYEEDDEDDDDDEEESPEKEPEVVVPNKLKKLEGENDQEESPEKEPEIAVPKKSKKLEEEYAKHEEEESPEKNEPEIVAPNKSKKLEEEHAKHEGGGSPEKEPEIVAPNKSKKLDDDEEEEEEESPEKSEPEIVSPNKSKELKEEYDEHNEEEEESPKQPSPAVKKSAPTPIISTVCVVVVVVMAILYARTNDAQKQRWESLPIWNWQ